MFGVALKGLLGHKLRMFLTAFSIIIGVSFVAGSYIFTDSTSAVFDGIFDDAYGSVDVIVQPKPQEFNANAGGSGFPSAVVPSDFVDSLRVLDGVEKISGEVAGSAQFVNKEGELVQTTGAPSLGFSWSDDETFNPLKVQPGGRAPQGPGEVVVDVNTAEVNGFAIGDQVGIFSRGEVEQFEIVGLVTFGEANTLAGATLASFEFSEAQRFFGLGDGFSQISVTASDGVSAEELKDRIGRIAPEGIESVTAEQQKNSDLDEINQGLGFLNTALLAFAGISIFVGSFIIQNTFRIIVTQRSKELALMRALGATKQQVIRLVVYEAFIVSIFASVLGIFAGIGISTALRAVSNAIGVGLPEAPLTVEARTIYVSFLVGIAVTLVSAIMPAVKASRVSPVEAMRDTEATTPRRSLHFRAVSGIVVTGIGAAALLYGLSADIADPIIPVGIGAAIMFIGVSVIAPLLSRPFAGLIGKPIELIYGVTGVIAQRNAKRSPRRTASTASALMIGVSLVVLATVFASSARVTVDDVVAESFPGDISLTSKLQQTDPFGATIPSQAVAEVEKLDEVELVSRLKYDFVKMQTSEPKLIVAIEPDTFGAAFELHPESDSYGSLVKDTVYVQADELERLGLNKGDTIEFEYALSGKKQLTISGTFEDVFDSPYLISDDTYFENFVNRDDLFVVANIKSDFSVADGREAIQSAVEKYPTVKVQDKNELISEARDLIDQALNILNALLAFAIIIAMLGITNTLTLSVAERTREIGMLRAIGMTRTQVRKMIRAEAIVIAVFGALLGAGMGIFFAWAILRALRDVGFTAFSLPVLHIAIYVGLAAIAGMIAAIVPSIKASRMNILNAINYE